MSSLDRDYYERRVHEEQAAALEAPDEAVAKVHRELASRYAAWLDEHPDTSTAKAP